MYRHLTLHKIQLPCADREISNVELGCSSGVECLAGTSLGSILCTVETWSGGNPSTGKVVIPALAGRAEVQGHP